MSPPANPAIPTAKVRHRGLLIGDTTIEGERKADRVTPNSARVAQLARDRWLITFATLHPTGWDASRSIFCQLRADSPVGPVLVEHCVARAEYREGVWIGNGSPAVFGVPRGAKIAGVTPPHADLFVLKWSVDPHRADPQRREPIGQSLLKERQRMVWRHFRLTDDGQDLQWLDEPTRMRQTGCEQGEAFCSLGAGLSLRQAQIEPISDDRTHWAQIGDFGDRLAPMLIVYCPRRHRYEWVHTGTPWSLPGTRIGEARILTTAGRTIICVRTFHGGDTLWLHTSDVMRVFDSQPQAISTRCTFGMRHAFVCGDGVIRMFRNDADLSPYGDRRNPLYVSEIDPHTCAESNLRVLFDAREAGLPIRQPFVDGAALVPHAGGRHQTVFFRVIAQSQTSRLPGTMPLNDAELAVTGVYHAQLEYEQPRPPTWTFV